MKAMPRPCATASSISPPESKKSIALGFTFGRPTALVQAVKASGISRWSSAVMPFICSGRTIGFGPSSNVLAPIT